MRASWVLLIVVWSSLESLALPGGVEEETKPFCGYESCPVGKPDKLNVHLICHSHDDVGWLKTPDEYFASSGKGLPSVRNIINSVVDALLEDSTKSQRFVYAETSYFWKWWLEQFEPRRAQVRGLVDSGQLEFVGGAWSMNDEAVTNYQSIIDQFTWGFRILDDTIGACATPRVGWQIDSFGHSREMASLLAQMGMDGMFVGRLDYQDMYIRRRNKTMQMMWFGSPDNLGSSADIFTQAIGSYSPPEGFCFDSTCGGHNLFDNDTLFEYDFASRIGEFVAYVQEHAKGFKTKDILVTMGGDFHYSNARNWFQNIDKLILYTNFLQDQGSKVNLLYSTPSCYLKALYAANETWSTKRDDFFPYSSAKHSYWTGYYTSKPNIKYFERLGNNFLQVSKQLTALAGMSLDDTPGVTELREAMGIMQHHNAITGTMKNRVAKEYSRILSDAIEQAGNEVSKAINKLAYNFMRYPVPVASCLLLNVSDCLYESVDKFIVTVHNPLARRVSKYVRLPVTKTGYIIRNSAGHVVPHQMIALSSWVFAVPGRDRVADTEIVFKADDLPPVGFRSYYISRSKQTNRRNEVSPAWPITRCTTLNNKLVTVYLDETGQLESIFMNNVEVAMSHTFAYYRGKRNSSGSYVFRPAEGRSININLTSAWIVKGELVEEVYQLYEDGWVAQVIRLYKDENHVEFEWQVGPIPDDDEVGKEVVSRYHMDLDTSRRFYTDSNGREMLKRVLNFRPTWPLEVNEPVASNFYPVTSRIVIRDEGKGREAAILVDRGQAGSSLSNGQMELMIHRRLFSSDNLGLKEPLNEIAFDKGAVSSGKHHLIIGPTAGLTPSLAAQQRLLAQGKLLQPWIFLSPVDRIQYLAWLSRFPKEFSGIRHSLPDNVHLLTLEPWGEDCWLVRLEHIMERGEDADLSAPTTVDLENLFTSFTIVRIQETTLGANKILKGATRFSWRTPGTARRPRWKVGKPLNPTAVTLEPMQIRTFIVDVSAKH